MNQRPLIEELQETDFLQGFSPDYLEELAAVATPRDFAAAQVVFREGDPATSAYLVVTGKASLEICAPSVGCRRRRGAHRSAPPAGGCARAAGPATER